MYGSNCKGAEEEGISILHGNRGVYHDDKQPTFKALYEVIRDVSDVLPNHNFLHKIGLQYIVSVMCFIVTRIPECRAA